MLRLKMQFAQVGLAVVAKVALSTGMTIIFTFYSSALSTLILIPLSFFFHRSAIPPLWPTFLYGFFLLGLMGWLDSWTSIFFSSTFHSNGAINSRIHFHSCSHSQAFVLKKYPVELIIMLFYSSCITILSAVFSLVTERDTNSWSLSPKRRLMALIYSGLFGNLFRV